MLVLQSTKPMQKLKRKSVYFVKTAPARLDNDNIKTLVGLVVAGRVGAICSSTFDPQWFDVANVHLATAAVQ